MAPCAPPEGAGPAAACFEEPPASASVGVEAQAGADLGDAWLRGAIAHSADVAARAALYQEELEAGNAADGCGTCVAATPLVSKARRLFGFVSVVLSLLRLWALDALGLKPADGALAWRQRVRVHTSADPRVKATRAGSTTAFIDGSAAEGGVPSVGVWYGAGHALNLSARVDGPAHSTHAELSALWLVLVRHPSNVPLTILSDSRNALGALAAAVADGPVPNTAPRSARALRLALQLRSAKTVARRVPGHSGHRDNDFADRLAAAAAADESARLIRVPQTCTRTEGGRDAAQDRHRTRGRQGARQQQRVGEPSRVSLRARLESPLSLVLQFGRELNQLATNKLSAAAVEAVASVEGGGGGVGNKAPRPPRKMRPPTPIGSETGLTDALALDCEMVGVGPRGALSALARVAVVNSHGHVVYHSWARPAHAVTDYRTYVSGVREEDIRDAPSEAHVCAEVHRMIKGRTLVGHSIDCDLDALNVKDVRALELTVRDTAQYRPLCHGTGRPKKLRVLARNELGILIQQKGQEHHPVDDARAAMYLYLKHRAQWEAYATRVARSAKGRSKRSRRDFGAGFNRL